MNNNTRVVLERGRTWTFASAVDWPGWCRRAKGEAAALEALADYEDRYRIVVGDLGLPAVPTFDVVEVLPGSASTDFGAPEARSSVDDETADEAEAARLVTLLQRCWAAFDGVVAEAAPSLRKGPRGGGRDRDAIVEHVREAERNYSRKIGVRLPPRTPWQVQREAIAEAANAALVSGAGTPTNWPARYYVRRAAWHVLDHAWEIEDRSER